MGRIKPKSVPAEASSIETFEPGGQNAVCFFRVSHSLKRFLFLYCIKKSVAKQASPSFAAPCHGLIEIQRRMTTPLRRELVGETYSSSESDEHEDPS
jgi:hypothetical protein